MCKGHRARCTLRVCGMDGVQHIRRTVVLPAKRVAKRVSPAQAVPRAAEVTGDRCGVHCKPHALCVGVRHMPGHCTRAVFVHGRRCAGVAAYGVVLVLCGTGQGVLHTRWVLQAVFCVQCALQGVLHAWCASWVVLHTRCALQGVLQAWCVLRGVLHTRCALWGVLQARCALQGVLHTQRALRGVLQRGVCCTAVGAQPCALALPHVGVSQGPITVLVPLRCQGAAQLRIPMFGSRDAPTAVCTWGKSSGSAPCAGSCPRCHRLTPRSPGLFFLKLMII